MAVKGPEVRIGLVLYGGVSLAVYIYGIVIEVQRLLRAAEELEGDDGRRKLSPYAEVLKRSGASAVTVDIASGTSAGGINGILLAKALAFGTDVEGVRDLWLEGGDIEQLLQPPSRRDPRSLLQSQHFERQLLSGMKKLGRPPEVPGPRAPIFDLFVSSTHLRGGERVFEDSLGEEIATRQHRFVFRLKLRREREVDGRSQGYEKNEFDDDERLVKLARATSAFPVAFEPVLIEGEDGLLERGEIDGWFADGGILNNKPFTEAVEAIVSRGSDRPVRRWLISVDPDPVPPAVEEDAGPEPPFDQIVLRSIATIPRYQSIVRDLVALREHNEKIDAAELVIREAEAELAGRLGEPPAAGAPAGYRAFARQAWGIEAADGFVDAVRAGPETGLDLLAVHREVREWVETIARTDPLQRIPDLAFQRRRIYYLIKLLSLDLGGEWPEPPEAFEADRDGERPPTSDGVREVLWGEYEILSGALWKALSETPVVLGGDRAESAREQIEDRLRDASGELQNVVEDSEERLRRALSGARVSLPLGFRGLAGSLPLGLDEVFLDFERRDAILLPADVLGGLRQRDRVLHAQVSPDAGSAGGVKPAGKLAGATMGHFGGFLDQGWRESDLMWGRLDGAEVLLAALGREAPGVDVRSLTRDLQGKIFAAERLEAGEAPPDWEQRLRDYAGNRAELGGGRMVSLGLRAASIVRRMLGKAAADADSGKLLGRMRAFALRSAANGLGFLLALLYLPATALFGKGRLVRRGATVVAFVPFLWGLATLVLGIVGVLSFEDVVGPAAVAIAVYPLFLLVYWGLSLAGWWLGRKLRRPPAPDA